MSIVVIRREVIQWRLVVSGEGALNSRFGSCVMSAAEHAAQMQRVVWVTHRLTTNVLRQGVPSAPMHRYDAFFGASGALGKRCYGGIYGSEKHGGEQADERSCSSLLRC